MPHHYRCTDPIDPADVRGGSLIDAETEYERDFTARVFVRMYPNGATLESVGAVFNVTRERIRQIEAKALRKLKATCQKEGLDFQDFLTVLGITVSAAGTELYWTDG